MIKSFYPHSSYRSAKLEGSHSASEVSSGQICVILYPGSQTFFGFTYHWATFIGMHRALPPVLYPVQTMDRFIVRSKLQQSTSDDLPPKVSRQFYWFIFYMIRVITHAIEAIVHRYKYRCALRVWVCCYLYLLHRCWPAAAWYRFLIYYFRFQ